MQHKLLGLTGLRVSPLCFGTMSFGGDADEAESARLYAAVRERGINFLDCADTYQKGRAEEILGRLMAHERDQLVITTKCHQPMGSDPNAQGSNRRHILRAVEASLRRLGTDRIDVLFMHRWDDTVPVEETLRTLDDLVRAGKLRYVGVSNFSGWHLMKSLAVADRYGLTRYVAHQAYYSLIGRDYEWELMPLGQDQKVGAVVWSPLGWGRLTGKLRRGQPRPETSRLNNATTAAGGPQVPEEYLFKVVDALDVVAKETGKTVPQVALNWVLQRPTVANVIIGARNEEQLRQNLGAIGWNLTPAQVAKLDAASAVTLAYPYWHQRGFAERNPPPL